MFVGRHALLYRFAPLPCRQQRFSRAITSLNPLRHCQRSSKHKHSICQRQVSATGGGGAGRNGSARKMTGEDDGGEGKGIKIFTFIYAGLLLVGGMMGYVKGKSVKSLMSGITLAAFFGICALGFGTPRHNLSAAAALFGSAAVTAFFFKRYRISRKVMPGLVGTITSFIMTIAYATQFF